MAPQGVLYIITRYKVFCLCNKVPYGAIRVVESKPFNIKIYFVLTMIYSIFIITCPVQKKRKNHDFFSYKYAKIGHKAYVSTFSFANVKNMLQ